MARFLWFSESVKKNLIARAFRSGAPAHAHFFKTALLAVFTFWLIAIAGGETHGQTITWNVSGSVTVDGGVYSLSGSVNLPAGGGSAGYSAAVGGITVTSTVSAFAVSGIGSESGFGFICQGAGGGHGPIVQTAGGLSAGGLISGSVHCDYYDGTSDDFPVTGSFSAVGTFDSSFPSTVSSVTGTVQVISNGVTQSVGSGFHLAEGMEIKTGGNGQATITFQDGSRVEIGPNSSFVLASAGGVDKATILERIKGFLKHTVQCFALSSGGSCYKVRTPTACACVRGTKFTTNYTKTGNLGSLITVVENGLVDVIDRKGTIVSVGAGQQFTLTEVLPPASVDIDGDGSSDIGIYRSGAWSIVRSSNATTKSILWGGPSWTPIPADYDGDGITDVAVYNNGLWSIVRSSDGGNTLIQWSGTPGDIPVPADFDGDGKADLAVYNSISAGWSIIRSSDNQLIYKPWGGPAWQPVVADYDGDGKADIAVYNPIGLWSIVRSSDGGNTLFGWSGAPNDIPVPADYDGDGKADFAIYNTSTAWWSIIRSSDLGLSAKTWGGSAWQPVVADYDGDGKTDIAVYNSTNGLWSIFRSSDGGNTLRGLGGGAQDVPLN